MENVADFFRSAYTGEYTCGCKPARFALFGDVACQNVGTKGEPNAEERRIGISLRDVIHRLSKVVCVAESVELRACQWYPGTYRQSDNGHKFLSQRTQKKNNNAADTLESLVPQRGIPSLPPRLVL